MGEGKVIIPEVLDPSTGDPGTGSRPDSVRNSVGDSGPRYGGDRRQHQSTRSPGGSPRQGRERGAEAHGRQDFLTRILSPIKAILIGLVVVAAIILAILFGSFIFLVFLAIFFVTFLISGLFGRRGASSSSIIIERYGPSRHDEVGYILKDGHDAQHGPGTGDERR